MDGIIGGGSEVCGGWVCGLQIWKDSTGQQRDVWSQQYKRMDLEVELSETGDRCDECVGFGMWFHSGSGEELMVFVVMN